jgi:uncharacterized protein (TIGR03083 family)
MADEIRDLYLDAASMCIEFCRTIEDEDWSRPVPCTPGWTVRDVLSHVSGVPDDVLNGRVEGVATAAWTASQLERNRHAPIDELLARWEEQVELFADAIQASGQIRAVFDCHCHEHDLRHALALPGKRDGVVMTSAAEQLVSGLEHPFAVSVEFSDGSVVRSPGGQDDPMRPGVELRGVTRFEVFRSRLGRRSRRQVESYYWTGRPEDVAATVDTWFGFGPSLIDIHD